MQPEKKPDGQVQPEQPSCEVILLAEEKILNRVRKASQQITNRVRQALGNDHPEPPSDQNHQSQSA